LTIVSSRGILIGIHLSRLKDLILNVQMKAFSRSW